MIKNEIIETIRTIIKKMRISSILDVLIFLGLRFGFGLTEGLMNLYAFALLLIGIPIEKITLIFFFLAVVLYILGGWVEANNYFSYVYVGMILSVVKYFYLILKDRKNTK